MLNDLCLQGAFPNTFIYHICGMPWASTNNVDFYRWINSTGTDTDRDDLRANLFGDDSENVQVLLNLRDNLGGQTVNYGEDKGITVGGWSVSLEGGANGFNWNNFSDMEQWGVIGLDWQPVESTSGVSHSVLSADVQPDLDLSNGCVVKWDKNKDFGLKDWLDDNYGSGSYNNDIYLYCSSSCIKPTAEAIEWDNYYSVACQSGKLNAPNEDILALRNRQNIFISNYPQGIEGLTANLYSVMCKDNTLVSGTDPYLMRTGKIKNNATQDNQGNWSISMGGFTDQLKFKNTIGSYKGQLSGFRFNKIDYIDGWNSSNEYHMPFVCVNLLVTDTSTSSDFSLQSVIELDADYKEFNTIDEILDYAIDLMNDDFKVGALTEFSKVDGDIRCDIEPTQTNKAIKFCQVSGLLPYVAGIGQTIDKDSYTYYINGITDPINSNLCRFYDSDQSSATQLDGVASFYLLETGGTKPPTINISGTRVYNSPTPMQYFIQHELKTAPRGVADIEIFEEGDLSLIPEDSSGNTDLTITDYTDSDIDLQVGMSLQFGNFGDETTGNSIKGEVSAISGNEISFTANGIYGAPMALYYNSSFMDSMNSDPDFLLQLFIYCGFTGQTVEDIKSKFTGDLFAVKDVEIVKLDTATDIFKGVLGDPDTDVGFNIGAVKTDIKNLFNRGEDNFIPMVNWDKFQELVDEGGIDGIKYKYTPESTIDVLSLLNGVCLTNNIQQIWEYNYEYRSWWLTFESFGSGNETTAVLKGRTIEELDISANELSAIVGGGWYYNKLSGKYKSTDGGNIELNYQMTDGRIGHSLKDKILTINDKISLLPVDSTEEQNAIILNFSTMAKMFSQVVYKQKLALNLRKTAVIGVGRWSKAEWPPIQNRQTGRRNDGALIGQVQSENINLSSGLIDIDLLSYPSERKGIAPSLYSVNVNQFDWLVQLSGLSTNPVANDFGDTDSLLTDQMYFQCIDEVSGKLVDRECSCDGYRVTLFERNPTDQKLYFDPAYADPKQNVFRGTMTKQTVDTISSAANVALDGNYTAFDDEKDWVVTFADRADEDLTDCQTDLYGWLADSKNQVTDSSGSKKAGIKVGN